MRIRTRSAQICRHSRIIPICASYDYDFAHFMGQNVVLDDTVIDLRQMLLFLLFETISDNEILVIAFCRSAVQLVYSDAI